MPQRRRIVCIGEAMLEFAAIDLAAGRARATVAGDTFNTAAHLARLLPRETWEVAYVTVLGEDALSGRMLARMQAEGIHTGLIGRHPERRPGLYAVETDAAGERSFLYWRSESAARQLFQPGLPGLEVLDGCAAVLLSLITLAILPEAVRGALVARLAALKAAGVLVAFDSNWRPALWPDAQAARAASAAMWKATVLALPSRDDEAALWPGETVAALCARLAAAGVDEIALKDGAAGPRLWAGAPLPAGPFPRADKVVDTAGAGDAFNAGYLAARLAGRAPAEAAQQGHALACHVIGQPGALPPPPG